MLESKTLESNSLVSENKKTFIVILEYSKTQMAWGNLPELTGKAKYYTRPIVN